MAKKKYVKLEKQYVDFNGSLGPIIEELQHILSGHPDAYIDSEMGYYDTYTEYVYWEVPMTDAEIKDAKNADKKLREERKRKKVRDDQQRKEKLQKLYKEHFGKDLELQ